MSARKSIALAATIASLVSVNALAGGPEYNSMAPSTGVYIDVDAGYAYTPWVTDQTTHIVNLESLAGTTVSYTNKNGGFTAGADLGYKFNQYFGLEAGWEYLPQFKATYSGTTAGTIKVNSGLAYAAFKLSAPLYHKLAAFGKLGAAYRYNKGSISGTGAQTLSNQFNAQGKSSNFWKPMFAAGLQYCITQSWSVHVQYAFVPGYHNTSSTGTSNKNFVVPDANLITAGVGYKFLL